MTCRKRLFLNVLLLLTVYAGTGTVGFAMDVSDNISVGGVLAGVYQYQFVDNAPGVNDTGDGAVLFQPEAAFQLTDAGEMFVKLGFAAGNGLSEDTAFALVPMAADMEADLQGINGSARDHLLTVWYKHTFTLPGSGKVGVTGGIIDATDYLDDNAYANDEFAQFMNESLVNNPIAFLPSYDTGAAVELESGIFTLKGVAMAVNENDAGKGYTYFGLQAGCTLESGLGSGTYRVLVNTTSKDFDASDGEGEDVLKSVVFSFDQALGETLGAWLRLGWADDSALVLYKDVYSGGIDISGSLWGRGEDNCGLGYAHLSGGSDAVDESRVMEIYWRIMVNDLLAFTADVQYQKDDYKDGGNLDGFVCGVRVTAEF